MKKVVYKTSNLFTLKRYNDNNLNCQSYQYPLSYTIKSAIIGSIIKVDGIEKAKDLFNKIKNMKIYVQFPKQFSKIGITQKRYSNAYYGKFNKLDREDLIKSNWKTTMGFREYIFTDEIVFYIDNSIDDIELYLKNIDALGTAESLVYLSSIEETNKLENVLVEWNKEDRVNTFEQVDYTTKTTFDTVYMYSSKYKNISRRYMCCIKDIEINDKVVVNEI